MNKKKRVRSGKAGYSGEGPRLVTAHVSITANARLSTGKGGTACKISRKGSGEWKTRMNLVFIRKTSGVGRKKSKKRKSAPRNLR